MIDAADETAGGTSDWATANGGAIAFAIVPEPTTLALLALEGIAGYVTYVTLSSPVTSRSIHVSPFVPPY